MRTRPCRVQRAGPRIPEGGPDRKAGYGVRAGAELVRAAGRCLRPTKKCFRAPGEENRTARQCIQTESRYGTSTNVVLYCRTATVSLTTVVFVEQDAKLSQMRQAIDQLCQEKAKEAERANKLAEELKGEFLLVGITVEVASLYDGTL